MGATCPACGEGFGTGERFCPTDGTRLFQVPKAISQRETEAVPTDPLLGALVDGRYRIDEKLGEGGMGAVYRATHTLMDKRVAVKVLREAYSKEPTAAKRFQREARSTSRLEHEHCIRVFDFGVTPEGLFYLVMEYLDGATLAEELHASGPLPPDRAIAIVSQVAAALEHAHALGIVHRDLKPDNIFITTRGTVKVLDFGLAKVVEDDTRAGTLTQAGMVFGTPEYMSPEQAEGRPLDPRSDIYSLGIVLYQMLTGHLPFNAPSFLGILTKHLTEPPTRPRARRPELSPELESLVLRCLEKDPANRFPDATSLLRSLQVVPTSRVAPSIAQHPTEDVRTPRRRWLLALAGAALLAIAIIGFAVTRPEKADPVAKPIESSRTPSPETRPPSPSPEPVAAPVPITPDAAPAPPAPPRPAADDETDTAADHLRAAATWRKKGNRIKELFELQQAVRLEPRNKTALTQLGDALIANGQKDAGCKTLLRAIDHRPAARAYDAAGCGVVQ